MRIEHLLRREAAGLPEELVEQVLSGKAFRVERIVSQGHCSEPGFWYDQSEHEWVMLLSGAAGLEFAEANGKPGRHVEMRPGDALLIPAHQRHRVSWTKLGEQSVWLAIFFTD